MVSEIIKKDQNTGIMAAYYFWRTHQQQEIDLIREKNSVFDAFEFKWSPSKKFKIPERFKSEYKGGSFMEIHRKNYTELLS